MALPANAQEKKYPEPEPMKPGMSEYWTPQRKVVTPGNIQTQSAPSDAIVLFDGTDLSKWEMEDGTAAAWTVKNGVMTVNKQKGSIPKFKGIICVSCCFAGTESPVFH